MKTRSQGFALIAAIILVVILAALAAFVASMVGGQSANQQLERMSRVTDLAARAGLEWGAYRVMRPPAAPLCPPTTTFTPPGSQVPVTVFCTRVTTNETGLRRVYQITAIATYGGVPASPDFVQRQKTAVFTR